jgi:peroxiredoxin
MIASRPLSPILSIAAAALLALVPGCDSGGGAGSSGAASPPAPSATVAPATTTAEAAAPPETSPRAETAPTALSDVAAGPPAAAPNPADREARIRAAHALLDEMARAYREAPFFEDRIVVEGTMGGSAVPTNEFTLRLGSGTDFYLTSGAMTITAVGGKLYVESRDSSDRFLAFDLQGDALATLRAQFSSYSGIMAQAALRYGKSYEEIIYTISFGCRDQTRIDNYRRFTDADGRELEQILLISTTGSVIVNVDPQTKFIVSADVEYQEPFAPVPNWVIKRHHVFHPKAGPELSAPIAFDVTGRQQVQCAPLMLGKQDPGCPVVLSFGLGEEAPDFTLHDLRGRRVRLADLRGVPVVISFWQSLDPMSVRLLPKLQEIQDRLQAGDRAVAVYALNAVALPVAGDPDRQWQDALDHMEDEEFTFPSLIDPKREVMRSWGVMGVPTTVVLDANGILVATVGGIDEATWSDRVWRAIQAVTGSAE